MLRRPICLLTVTMLFAAIPAYSQDQKSASAATQAGAAKVLSVPAAAAVVMKTDGTSQNCLLDPEQSLTVSTPAGDIPVAMKDLVWMAGGEVKRVRRLGGGALLRGRITSEPLRCFQSAKDQEKGKATPIAVASLLFVYTGDVKVEKKRELTIEEAGGTRLVLVSEVRTKDFFVTLLPENWDADLTLDNPVYTASMSKRDTLKVGVTVKGSATDLRKFADQAESGKAEIALFARANNFTFWTHAAFPKDLRAAVDRATTGTKDAGPLAVALNLDYGTPFYLEVNGQVLKSIEGTGSILVYLRAAATEFFARNRLEITPTLSNVQRLPINITGGKTR